LDIHIKDNTTGMNWISIENPHKPPQGLKVLCFRKGDIWVCQRFSFQGQSYWLPIPFCDSKFSSTDNPEWWSYISHPSEVTRGFMKVKIGGQLLTIDVFEENYPDEHQEFVKALILSMKNPIKESHAMASIKAKTSCVPNTSRYSKKS